jgi:chromosome segregation ATPase
MAFELRRSHPEIAEEDQMKTTEGGLRRTWFRGVRSEDVDRAIGLLAERNRELEAELVDAAETARGLVERLSSAEETLETFHATLEHIGTILSLAEERSREIELAAQAEAARIRAAAEEREREAEAKIESLVSHKRQVLTELAALGAGIAAVSEHSEAPAANVHTLPVREQATAAV